LKKEKPQMAGSGIKNIRCCEVKETLKRSFASEREKGKSAR